MDLDYNLFFVALILFLLVLIVVIYKILLHQSNSSKKSLQSFKTELRIFLKNSFPNIAFDYAIYQQISEEKESSVKQMLIAENIALQFARFDFKRQTQPSIQSNLLWSSYEFDSTPRKNKAPKNLSKIKELAYKRDNASCLRCGRLLKLEHAHMAFVKSINKGGTYHFENIMTVCVNCNRVLHSKQPSLIAKDLPLMDEILKRTDF